MTGMGDEESFQAQVGGICPFCQRKFQAGHDKHGVGGVLHELPTCQQFDDLEPDEYLKAVRIKYSD